MSKYEEFKDRLDFLQILGLQGPGQFLKKMKSQEKRWTKKKGRTKPIVIHPQTDSKYHLDK